jgi:hypothetical protein
MVTNHLLQAKYRIQKQLETEAQYDLKNYVQNVQRMAKEAEKTYKVKFKYSIAKPSQNKDELTQTKASA